MADVKSLEKNAKDTSDEYQPSFSSASSDRSFGRLAVLTGLIDERHLSQAFAQQADQGAKSLADILTDSGVISVKARQAVEFLLEAQEESQSSQPRQIPADTDSQQLKETVAFIAQPNADRPLHKQFGDYEILSEIARGGMGVVYKARQTKLNRLVALKMIRSGEFANNEQVQRFYAEAEIAAKLDHPAIVPVYEVGEANGQHFFSMALIVGRSLNERVKTEGPLAPKEAARLLKTVVEAVEYAHRQGIVHRDIKPHNILLDAAGTPRLSDFGLAKFTSGESDLTVTGQVMGTPSYMPPEQARGSTTEIGPAADVYSLGATLYFLLTGRPPFQSSSHAETIQQLLNSEPAPLRRLNPAIPRDLETICLKCLRKEPSKRYRSPQGLADDLRNWLENRPIVARRVGLGEQAWLWCKRRPTLVGLSLVFLVISIIGITAGTFLAAEQQNATRTAGLVDALANAETFRVPDLYEELAPYRQRAQLLLQEKVATENDDSKVKLHASLALVAADPGQVDFLVSRLLQAEVEDVPVIVRFLAPHKDMFRAQLWQRLKDGSCGQRIRAAAALAQVDPQNAAWQVIGPDVVRALLSVPVTESKPWIALLFPVAQSLTDPLETHLRNRNANQDAERPISATALASFLANNPTKLSELILLADNEQEFKPLVTALRPQGEIGALTAILRQPLPTEVSGFESLAAAQDANWKRQASAAVCLLGLGKNEDFWQLLRKSEDTTLRSFIIQRLAELGADIEALEVGLSIESEPSIRQALILALGDFDSATLSAQDRQRLAHKITTLYAADPDPGVHAAADWMLRQWRVDVPEKPATSTGREFSIGGQPSWFRNSQGHTLVVIPGNEAIPHAFAISNREITVAEFQKFRPEFKYIVESSPQPNCPVNNISWYDAVAYCNWLSEQDAVPREQWCYEPNAQGEYAAGMKIPADFNQRSGYRLPCEAEWEHACRGGTKTTYEFGESLSLSPRYVWCNSNSKDRSQPVGLLRPNLLGLFDMHGNLWEWCQDRPPKPGMTGGPMLEVDSTASRALRSGSYSFSATNARSSGSIILSVHDHRGNTGFRIVKSGR